MQGSHRNWFIPQDTEDLWGTPHCKLELEDSDAEMWDWRGKAMDHQSGFYWYHSPYGNESYFPLAQVLKRTVVPEEPLFNPTPFSACEREPGTTAIEAGSDAAARVQKVVDAISDFHVSKDKHYGKRVTIRDLHIAYMKGEN